jgi:hypothetical protein
MAERTGDVTTEARCLTYLTVAARKRGLTDQVRVLAAQSLTAAVAAHMPEYVATAQANLAWVAWREDRLDDCESKAHSALEQWAQLPAGHASAAFQWTALWPLIGVCLVQGRADHATTHATELLVPTLMRLPAGIEERLSAAVECWERDDRAATADLLEEAFAEAGRAGWV